MSKHLYKYFGKNIYLIGMISGILLILLSVICKFIFQDTSIIINGEQSSSIMAFIILLFSGLVMLIMGFITLSIGLIGMLLCFILVCIMIYFIVLTIRFIFDCFL